MRDYSIEKKTVMRGRREYLEIDGANHRYENLKQRLKKADVDALRLSKENITILCEFLSDLEKGKYVSKNSPKGGRSPKRLVRLFYSLRRIIECIKGVTITDITEKQLEKFFDDLNSDKLRKVNGEIYKDKRDFKRDFSSFWHWHMMKTYKTKDQRINDITEYITTNKESRPDFLFFTLDELKEKILSNTNNEDLKALFLVLFDLGARPAEFYNLKLKDVRWSDSDNKYLIDIPEEVSKTFGRKIKLWISSIILKKYLARHDFQPEDYIFIKKKNHMKKFLFELNKKEIWKQFNQKVHKNITFYDFRHSSSCYYLNKYPTAKDMKYRFGWKKEDKIEYYTHFLGKQDFLSEEDMLSPEDKTRLEKELDEQRKKNLVIGERMVNMERQLNQLHEVLLRDEFRDLLSKISKKELVKEFAK
ncbi:MAG: site-specific integrase [Nanoarchaeota archaeon]|nr:site-specific integrase [Nanoarchaeota archaeon]